MMPMTVIRAAEASRQARVGHCTPYRISSWPSDSMASPAHKVLDISDLDEETRIIVMGPDPAAIRP